jgi:hypothetical protein
MFLLRSAFWLTVAYLAIAPGHFDFGAAAGDLSSQAVSAGKQMIVSKVLEGDCATIECLGGKAMVAAAVTTAFPSVDTAMQDSSNAPVPVPKPRPDWMG